MGYLPGDPEEEPQLVVTLQLHRLVGLKAKVTGYLQKTKHVRRAFKELYWKSNLHYQGSHQLVIFSILSVKISKHWKQNQQSLRRTGCYFA